MSLKPRLPLDVECCSQYLRLEAHTICGVRGLVRGHRTLSHAASDAQGYGHQNSHFTGGSPTHSLVETSL